MCTFGFNQLALSTRIAVLYKDSESDAAPVHNVIAESDTKFWDDWSSFRTAA